MADHGDSLSRSGTWINKLSNLKLQRSQSLATVSETRGSSGLHTIVPTRDAVAEIVFVHGIRGDQKLSWTSDSSDTATFWPSWLTDEPGFSQVRVHSFGYNADPAERKIPVSELNEFGKLLCETISCNTHFKRDTQNQIIFVAHSLGGLVVKAAINHAKRRHDLYDNLSQRFHTVLFLATPHRRANNLQMLNNIIRATGPSQPVHGLDPNAPVIENINEDFRFHYHGIQLYSFYESKPTLPGLNDLVVDKTSAILDLQEEHTIMLPATHISIARYSTSADPNYLHVRDTLTKAISEIEEELKNPEKINDQLRTIALYFNISESEQDELSSKSHELTEGTCEWLLNQQDFLNWRNATPVASPSSSPSQMQQRQGIRPLKHPVAQVPKVYWLQGPAGSGKSFLAARVVVHLRQDRDCSFYFLKHGDQSRQNLAGMLKSLAYQMARHHVTLRRWLFSIAQEDALTAEPNDFRAIWKQLFVQKIFQTELPTRHYWVIDAIDEGRGGYDLVGLLSQIPRHLPYSIFLTSRKDARLEQAMREKKLAPVVHAIDTKNSLEDIRTYLAANVNLLPVSDPADVQGLISRLVEQSRGSFLWTSLVLKKLDDSWTRKERERILNGVPEGMEKLYIRIVSDMARGEHVELARAMLRWTVCAIVPLTINQFQEAIQLDIQDEVTRIEEAISRTCGQFITVEQGHVRLVHDTVREFLLDQHSDNKFAVRKSAVHGTIASICLGHLTVDARNPRLRAAPRSRSKPNPTIDSFHDYASKNFSEHVVKSNPNESDSPLSELLNFLQTSTLYWIEYCARQKDLSRLTLAGKNLKSYVQERVDFQSPLSRDLRIVQEWSSDLIHLATTFGKFLLTEPSAIHSVIPPLCPKRSRIFRDFGKPALGLEVIGRLDDVWSDLLSSTRLEPDYAQAIACCEQYFSVGTRNGLVMVFSAFTCQEEWSCQVGEPVKQLEFAQSPLHPWIAVSTRSKLMVLDYQSRKVAWTAETNGEVLALAFTTSIGDVEELQLTAVTKKFHLETYNLIQGKCESAQTFLSDSASNRRRKPPGKVYISDELGSVALVWRNEPVEIYTLANLRKVRYAKYKSSVEALVFNPAMNMVAASTFDGELSIMGLWNLQQTKSMKLAASHLATATDGRTLVAGSNNGSIKILDFETLNLLHTIPFSEEEIVSIVFSGNGLRFLDIRRQMLNVWEPSALVRRKDTDRSTSTSASEVQTYSTAPSQLVETYLMAAKNLITKIASDDTGRFIFCGKQNGDVTVHDVHRSGHEMQHLFHHDRSAVTCLSWDGVSKILVSCDNANQVMVHQLKLYGERSPTGTRDRWSLKLILTQRLNTPEPVRQVICSVPPHYLLVSTTRTDHVWKLDGTLVTTNTVQAGSLQPIARKWTSHPAQKRRFMGLQSCGPISCEWDGNEGGAISFDKPFTDVSGTTKLDIAIGNVHIARCEGNTWLACDDDPHSELFAWVLSSSTSSKAVMMLERFRDTGSRIKSILGMFESQLVFISIDDWVETMRLDEHATQHDAPVRRFPLSHYWHIHNDRQRPLVLVTRLGGVVVATGDELAIIQNGLRQYVQ